MTPTEIRAAIRVARAELSLAGHFLDIGKPVIAYGHAEKAQHLAFDVKTEIGRKSPRELYSGFVR